MSCSTCKINLFIIPETNNNSISSLLMINQRVSPMTTLFAEYFLFRNVYSDPPSILHLSLLCIPAITISNFRIFKVSFLDTHSVLDPITSKLKVQFLRSNGSNLRLSLLS